MASGTGGHGVRAFSLSKRAEFYRRRFPRYPQMWVSGGWLMGVWVIGNLYGRADPTIYGGFPGNFLKRVLTLFPDRERRLDLFAGHTPAESGSVRVDRDATRRPTVVADAGLVLPFADGAFDFVLADPPYSAADATQYGFPMIDRRKVMHETRRVVATGGWLAWLDTVRPMYRRQDWTQVGAVGVLVSTNTRVRLLSLFVAQPTVVTQPRLDLGVYVDRGADDRLAMPAVERRT